MPSADKAAGMLARFPGPVVLYPSRTKWLLVLAWGALFALGGHWMVRNGEEMGWFVLVFFGLVAVIAAAAMLPGAGSLSLDRDGFAVTSLFRGFRARWQDTTGFEAGRIPPAPQRFVLYDDVSQSGGTLGKINVAIAGRNCALPDNYGLPVDDLARLMAQWRERALASGARG